MFLLLTKLIFNTTVRTSVRLATTPTSLQFYFRLDRTFSAYIQHLSAHVTLHIFLNWFFRYQCVDDQKRISLYWVSEIIHIFYSSLLLPENCISNFCEVDESIFLYGEQTPLSYLHSCIESIIYFTLGNRCQSNFFGNSTAILSTHHRNHIRRTNILHREEF